MIVSPNLGVGRHAEGRVFSSQLVKSDGHLFLVGLGLGLDLHFDDGIREFHLLEDDGLRGIAERVTGAGFLQADESDDVACIGLGDFLAVVGVHENHAADTLGLLAGRVQQSRALVQDARVDAAEGQDAVLVIHELEREERQRFGVRRLADGLFAGLRVDALDRRTVERRGKIIDNRVEQRLNALVLEGRAAEDREEGAGQNGLAQQLLDGLVGEFLAVQIVVHRLVVEFGAGFDHVGAGLDSGVHEVRRDLFIVIVGTEGFILPDDRLHADEVDDALEIGFSADRQLDRDRTGAETLLDVLDALLEGRAGLVHLVAEDNARNAVLVALAPHGLGLGLNALVRVRARRQHRRAHAANARLRS